MKPKISCVMPTRNRSHMIAESIKSIIDQTVPDWELIIVDDHSDESDKTEEVVKSFDDGRIHYYKLSDGNGKGIACARNFGNMVATGDIIAVMDSDDVSYPFRFELTLKEFQKKNCDVVYGEHDVWDVENNEVRPRKNEYRSVNFDINVLLERCFIPHITVAYKRILALDFPYNSFYRVAEDYDLFLRLAKISAKFSFINKSLCKYRKHNESATKQKINDFDYGIFVRETYSSKRIDFADLSMKPKISCVMPTRNRSHMIAESIKSIIDQTVPDWELIIVDDHSDESDKTEEVVKSFDDGRIHYYKLSDGNGKGIACARNFGNMVATGDIIAVMDSDDVSYPFRFELTLKEFQKKNCDVVYGEIDYWNDETGDIKRRDNDWYARKFDYETYQKLNFIPHSSTAYRRSLGREFVYNSFFKRAEDYDIFLRMAKYENILSYIDKSIVKYRKHQGAITKQKMLEFDYDNIAKTNSLTKEQK